MPVRPTKEELASPGAALAPDANSFADPKVTLMIVVSAIVGLVVSFLEAGWVRRRMPSFPA